MIKKNLKAHHFVVIFLTTMLTISVKAQTYKDPKIKKIVLSHALEQTPQGLWYSFISKLAKEKNLVSEIPQLPTPNQPTLKSWQETITPIANRSPQSTVLIGHSLGCVNLLHYLDSYHGKEKFPLLILVAPTVFEVGYDALKEFFDTPFELNSLKDKVENIVVIISPTDPVLKPDPLQHGMLLVKEADAKLIVIKRGNHFWSGDDYSQLEKAITQEIDTVLK
jgi:uncharacterized protein